MSSSFQSILLLDKNCILSASRLEKEIRQIAGGFVHDLDIPIDDSAQPNLLTFNGVRLAILNIDAPAPGFSDYRSDGPNLLWPTVEADLAKHQAHIVVSCPTEGEGREECLGLASVVTFVTAAILKLTSTIGVYWPAGENFVTSDTFLSAAEGYGRGEGPPVMAWVRLYAAQEGQSIVLSTHGLKHFAGRELDFAPSTLPLGTLMQHALSIAHYLSLSGAEFKAGETIGPEGKADFRIELNDTGRLDDGPVFVLLKPMPSSSMVQ